MKHHIVGFRKPVPRVVISVMLATGDSDLLGRIWFPGTEPGVQDKENLYVLAGWEIHREAVE